MTFSTNTDTGSVVFEKKALIKLQASTSLTPLVCSDETIMAVLLAIILMGLVQGNLSLQLTCNNDKVIKIQAGNDFQFVCRTDRTFYTFLFMERGNDAKCPLYEWDYSQFSSNGSNNF